MKLLSSTAWRWYLGIAGLVIIAATFYYTNYLASRLSSIEENYAEIYSMAQQEMYDWDDENELYCDATLEGFILENNYTLPVLNVDYEGKVIFCANFGKYEADTAYMERELERWISSGIEPVESYGTLTYLGRSPLLGQLRFFPIIQFFLIGAFLVFGYLGINAARKAEQNRVWVGLAKETAHQLGTPISAIIGWLEHLKMNHEGDEDLDMVTAEMGKDVHRLEMVANRFSKIGSEPELKPVNIYEQLRINHDYMAVRAPRRVVLDFPVPAEEEPVMVKINALLFDWVVENLLRNAIDALEGKGEINASVMVSDTHVRIFLSDTGKGIPANKHKAVFNPGYTTKKRGWGLGLSLAKRIIELYHKGRIFVERSEPGKGTTFGIELPRL